MAVFNLNHWMLEVHPSTADLLTLGGGLHAAAKSSQGQSQLSNGRWKSKLPAKWPEKMRQFIG